jgi:T-complex protein 1 subunit beta
LREAEFLVNQRVHPMTIMAGWRQAVQIARAALDGVAIDNSADENAFREGTTITTTTTTTAIRLLLLLLLL